MAEDHIPQGVSPAIFVFGKLLSLFYKLNKIEIYEHVLDYIYWICAIELAVSPVFRAS